MPSIRATRTGVEDVTITDRVRALAAGRAARNISWGLADQALYSATNLAVVLVVARYTSQEGFGSFAVAMSAFYLLQGLIRALTGEVLVVLANEADAEPERLEGPCVAFALLCGVLGGIVLVIVGSLVGGTLGPPLAALGVVLPLVMLQDANRYVAFSRRSGRLAFGSDLTWALVQIPTFGVVIATGPDAARLILAWGVAGAAAALWATRVLRLRLSGHGRRTWLRAGRDLAPYFFGESFASTGLAQVRTFSISAAAGLAVTGAMRGANALMSPLNTIFQGAAGTLVAELGHSASHGGLDRLARRTAAIAAVTAGLAVTWGTVIYLAPDGLGSAVLGDSWEESREIIPLVTITVAASGVSLGALTGIRALGAARAGLAARVSVGVALLVLGTVGAAWSGATGAVTGLAVGQVAGTAVWWLQFRRALHRRMAETVSPSTD